MSETTQDGPVLGRWWFGVTAEEDAGHRQALLEAADLASRREQNFDQPWWAANVRALLEYVAMLEAAVAAAEQRGRDETEEERADLERQNIELGRASRAEQAAHRRALAAAEQRGAEAARREDGERLRHVDSWDQVSMLIQVWRAGEPPCGAVTERLGFPQTCLREPGHMLPGHSDGTRGGAW